MERNHDLWQQLVIIDYSEFVDFIIVICHVLLPLIARSDDLQKKDQRLKQLNEQYEKVEQQLEKAERNQKRVLELEAKIIQQECELDTLRQQKNPSPQKKIQEQEQVLEKLQMSLKKAKEEAEQAKKEAFMLKSQLDQKASQTFQSLAAKNPYFDMAADQWPPEYHLQHEAFQNALFRIKQDFGALFPKPLSCFVSYAWGYKPYEKEVERLVRYLEMAGFTIPFDRDNRPGKEPTHQFIQHIVTVDFVVICGSKIMMQKYRWKASSRDDRQPVVKSELNLIEELVTKNEFERCRMRPLVFEGSMDESLPPLLHGYVYYSFQYMDYFEIIFELIQSMYNIPSQDKKFEAIRTEFLQRSNKIANTQLSSKASPINNDSNQVVFNENTQLRKKNVELKERIRVLEAELLQRNQVKEESATKIQSVFRGFLQRKQNPISRLAEKRRDEIDEKISELLKAKRRKEVSQLSMLAEEGRWHDAMQMIQGMPQKNFSVTVRANTPNTVNNNNNVQDATKTITVKY